MRGPSNSLTLNEASGNASIGEALRIMRRGQADVMITGATGTSHRHSIKDSRSTARRAGQPLAGRPETWSRPFDATRNGQVLGEGACAMMLEMEDFAAARATIYGSILGSGSSCVIDKHGRPNYQLAFVNAAKAALRDAGVTAD